MEINERISKRITETSYLSTENTKRYRPILRFFYEQYERINYMLYKEDVYNELCGKFNFEDYTIDMCESDLKALVEWGNLIAIQDTNNVNTVEEFKHRNFRYQLSEYTVEIERMTIKLENLHIESASLEPRLIEKIKDAILKIDSISKEPENNVYSWWEDLNDDFKKLNQDYQDYLKTFYNRKLEEIAKSSQFIPYKNNLVKYLREFIKLLQDNSFAIEEKLKKLDSSIEDTILNKCLSEQINIQKRRIDRLEDKINEVELKERNKTKWENIKIWFVGSSSRRSEVENINEKTTEIIRKITRIATQIAETRGNVSSKKAQYQKICEMFCRTTDIEEAHKLSSLVFGIFNTRHMKGNFSRDTDSIFSSLIEEKSNEIEVRPRIRNYREKIAKSTIADKTKEKEKRIKEYMKQLETERQEVEKYIDNNKIILKDLPQVKTHFRKTILKWITKARLLKMENVKNEDGSISKQRTITIEDGRKVMLMEPNHNERCVLKCEDGNLDMPAYEIVFIN